MSGRWSDSRRKAARALCLLLSLLCSVSVLAAPATSIVIDVSPGATYRLDRSGDELTLIIRDNSANVRPQLEALRSSLVLGTLVLSGPRQETIVRIKLAPGLLVNDRQTRSPSRIVLGLGYPEVRRGGGVAVPEAVKIDRLRVLDEVLAAQEPAKKEADLTSNLLCIGSRVMYPVPLPENPMQLGEIEPERRPLGTGREAEIVGGALKSLEAGKPNEALRELKRFVLRYPKSPLYKDAKYYVVEATFESLPRTRPAARLEAVELLRDAVRNDPQNPLRVRSLYLAGLTYLDLKYYQEAATMFEDVLAALPAGDPRRLKGLLALGWAEHHRFDNDKSMRHFREALPLMPEADQGEAVLVMASIAAQKGEYQRVQKLIELVRAWWPALQESLAYLVLDAESLYRLDRFSEARARYELVRKVMGMKIPRVYEFRIGESLMMEGRFNDARRYFTTPPTDSRSDTRRWQDAMQQLRQLQMSLHTNTEETRRIIDLEKLRKLRLDNPFAPVAEEVLIEFVKYYIQRDNLSDALGILRTFLNVHQGNSQRRAVVSLVWKRVRALLEEDYKAERYFELLGLYERAFPIIAGEQIFDAGIAYLIARSYLVLGLYDQAYQAVSEAFFVEGSTRQLADTAVLMLAEIQRKQRRFEESRRTLAFLRSRTRDSASLRLAALEEARLLEAEGKIEQAVAGYQRYAATETSKLEQVQTLTRAAGLLSSAKGCKTAMPALKEAVTVARQLSMKDDRAIGAEPYYRLGECQFTLEQYGETVDTLMTALARKPDHALAYFARYALARSYQQLNRPADAEILFRGLAREQSRAADDPWVRLAGEAVEQLDWNRKIEAMN